MLYLFIFRHGCPDSDGEGGSPGVAVRVDNIRVEVTARARGNICRLFSCSDSIGQEVVIFQRELCVVACWNKNLIQRIFDDSNTSFTFWHLDRISFSSPCKIQVCLLLFRNILQRHFAKSLDPLKVITVSDWRQTIYWNASPSVVDWKLLKRK